MLSEARFARSSRNYAAKRRARIQQHLPNVNNSQMTGNDKKAPWGIAIVWAFKNPGAG